MKRRARTFSLLALLLLGGLLLMLWRSRRPHMSESAAADAASAHPFRTSAAAAPAAQGLTRISKAEHRQLKQQIEARGAAPSSEAPAPSFDPAHRQDVAGTGSLERLPGGALSEPGALSREYIQAKIAEIVPLLKECYESVLERQPTLGGRLEVRFAIEGEPGVGGIVSESEILPGGLGDVPELATCVRETTYTLKFDPPRAGGRVTVVYPFVFESTQKAPKQPLLSQPRHDDGSGTTRAARHHHPPMRRASGRLALSCRDASSRGGASNDASTS